MVVRGALVRFARWLRSEYEFPVRVPVYLNSHDRHITVHGELASASFFAPYDRTVEPYIRIATGDYPALEADVGRDNALASFICSFAHEVIHYLQWLESGTTTEDGVEEEADEMLRRYAETVDHP